MDFRIVIEVDEHVPLTLLSRRSCHKLSIGQLAAFPPMSNSVCPPFDRFVAVSAKIKLRIPMQTDIHKISDQILSVGPFLCRIGKDKRDVVSPKQIKELGNHEARMPDLDRISQLPSCIRAKIGSRFQFVVMPPGEVRCFVGISGQESEKLREPFFVPPK